MCAYFFLLILGDILGLLITSEDLEIEIAILSSPPLCPSPQTYASILSSSILCILIQKNEDGVYDLQFIIFHLQIISLVLIYLQSFSFIISNCFLYMFTITYPLLQMFINHTKPFPSQSSSFLIFLALCMAPRFYLVIQAQNLAVIQPYNQSTTSPTNFSFEMHVINSCLHFYFCSFLPTL